MLALCRWLYWLVCGGLDISGILRGLFVRLILGCEFVCFGFTFACLGLVHSCDFVFLGIVLQVWVLLTEVLCLVKCLLVLCVLLVACCVCLFEFVDLWCE